jgi:tetratricopeptide (TPR) repeat protein
MAGADTVELLCQKAKRSIEQRDWTKAKLYYLQALVLSCELPDVHYGLATVYFQLRELTSAAHHFREVTRLDPQRAGAFINLGAVLNLLQEYPEAITALQKAIRLDPQRVEGYYNLGVVYRRNGQPDLAMQAYKEALRLNPRMPDAHLNLANILMERENFKQAQHHYKEALQLRPNWEKALDGLASVEAALNPEPVATATADGSGAHPHANLDRTVDPVAHGAFLSSLHDATIEADECGQQLEVILSKEVEPAIKDLSTCLLYPHTSRTELERCILKFEHAMERLRAGQRLLQLRVDRVRDIEQKLPES